ncbi:MAG: DUF3800 domain-containing protein [Gemmatimonadales bacterium]
MPKPIPSVRHFFVDEAGDLTLFDRRGKTIVGSPGTSNTFMVGICELPEPAQADAQLSALRGDLLRDPYFRGVPSMAVTSRKTALGFHAKDDIPEVRREVFKLLPALKPKAIVAIRRKRELADFSRELFRVSGRKLTPNDVYDQLVERACTTLLHKAEENRFVFARRGKSDRNTALTSALHRAKERFNRRWRTDHDKPVVVASGVPSQHAGLQVADYLLWAIQRLYEKGEERYYTALAPHYRLVMDLDDLRHKPYGEWYSDSHPLSLQRMKPVTPG